VSLPITHDSMAASMLASLIPRLMIIWLQAMKDGRGLQGAPIPVKFEVYI